ncbi:MAG: GAF domain-containing protein [Planctomycetes bacterium]|nr:GAF domain-containing protein [Planctomycetota bacterium]
MATPNPPDILKQSLSGSGILNDAAAEVLKASGASSMLALMRHTLKDDRDGLKSLERIGDTFLRVGAPKDACECYREAMGMAERMGDKERVCRFHLALGSALDEGGQPTLALESYRSGMTLARALGDRGLEARFLNNLGILSQKGNAPHEAIPYYEKSLVLKEEEKDFRGALSTRLNLAALLATLTRWPELDPHIEKILLRAREVRDDRSEAYGYLLQGQGASARGKWESASASLSSALALFQKMGDAEGELAATLSMAEAAIELRDAGHAYVLLKAGQEMADRLRDGPRSARILTLYHRLDRILAPPGRDHTTTPIEEITRERNGLSRLQEVTHALNCENDPARIFDRILDATVSLTGAERAFLMLREGEEMRVRASRSQNAAAAPAEAVDKGVSRTIAESVGRRGIPVVSTSAVQDKDWSTQRSVSDLNLRATLCVPVRSRKRVLGVIYVDDRRRDHAFGLVDLRLLESLADQAALALFLASTRTEAAPAQTNPFEGKTLAEVERAHIEATLRSAGGNDADAARRLGLTAEELADRRR